MSGTKAKMPASEVPSASHNASKRRTSISSPPAKKLKPNTDIDVKNEIEDEEGHPHLDYTHVSSTWLDKDNTHSVQPITLQLSYHKGDMFANAPKGCVLIHACNTQGHWGAGIAKAFKQQYSKAYADHHIFCVKEHSKTSPVPRGTAQLLAPRDGDSEHWIGCVFTSAKYGKGKDKPDQIIKNTANSMQMLLELISKVTENVTSIRMCKINSGKFGVPWERTEDVLKGLAMQPWWPNRIEVWEPEE